MKSLKDWCKGCFGFKSISDRIKDELIDIEQELFSTVKTETWIKYRIEYLEFRRKQLNDAKVQIT